MLGGLPGASGFIERKGSAYAPNAAMHARTAMHSRLRRPCQRTKVSCLLFDTVLQRGPAADDPEKVG